MVEPRSEFRQLNFRFRVLGASLKTVWISSSRSMVLRLESESPGGLVKKMGSGLYPQGV